jgi:6-pyruvoyltetrahydropterin/6-carboxytetrahydropterin synthase
MKTTITYSEQFHAAHELTWHKGKCSNLHGHTYLVELTLEGDLTSDGIIEDFDRIGELLNSQVLNVLDHSFLNEIISNPTAELIAAWIFDRLAKSLDGLDQVRVWETSNTSAIVRR